MFKRKNSKCHTCLSPLLYLAPGTWSCSCTGLALYRSWHAYSSGCRRPSEKWSRVEERPDTLMYTAESVHYYYKVLETMGSPLHFHVLETKKSFKVLETMGSPLSRIRDKKKFQSIRDNGRSTFTGAPARSGAAWRSALTR